MGMEDGEKVLQYHLKCKDCGRTLDVNAGTLVELRGTIDNEFVIVKSVTCSCGCFNVVQFDNTLTEQMLKRSINNMRVIAKQVNNGQTKSKKKSKQIIRWNKILNEKRKKLAEKYDNKVFTDSDGINIRVVYNDNILNGDGVENAEYVNP